MDAIVPIPKCDLSIRLATMDDLSFLDALQKTHNKALGFFPRAQMEGYVKNEWVLVAEATKDEGGRMKDEGNTGDESSPSSSFIPHPSSLRVPIGYIASRDRYLKRDELGVIYQLCVEPGAQRKLVGAALVGEVFTRSAYGCRLYCCWCAKDLEANYFWESLGFVPVAFRAGSAKRGKNGGARVHIFWQKRIVDGDVETKWWYPSQTNQGAIREDRLVFPIPPGTHWTEVQAVAVPQGSAECKVLSAESEGRPKRRTQNSALRAQHLCKGPLPPTTRRVQFGRPGAILPSLPQAKTEARPTKVKSPKEKIDPKLVAAARELRDRYLEQVNVTPLLSQGKYRVARALPDPRQAAFDALPTRQLAA